MVGLFETVGFKAKNVSGTELPMGSEEGEGAMGGMGRGGEG